MKTIRKVIRLLLKVVLGAISLAFFYLLSAIILTFIPANSSAQQPTEGISIYLVSNGFHADLVLPSQNEVYDWRDYLAFEKFAGKSQAPSYLAFGWGDKGFFYDVPTIDQLTLTVVGTALFLPSTSVMHVIMYFEKPYGEDVKEIKLTPKQYEALVLHIKSGFQTGISQQPNPLKGSGYSHLVDNFYLGEGNYNLFTTCNDWLNSGLKKAGVKTATWAPFTQCLEYHFE